MAQLYCKKITCPRKIQAAIKKNSKCHSKWVSKLQISTQMKSWHKISFGLKKVAYMYRLKGIKAAVARLL